MLNAARHLAFVLNEAHCVAYDLFNEQRLLVLFMLMLHLHLKVLKPLMLMKITRV